MALLESSVSQQPGSPAAPGMVAVRRCTFRRVAVVARRRQAPLYDVACLYPDRQTPIPLGDMQSAQAICERCTAQGIFRPDSD